MSLLLFFLARHLSQPRIMIYTSFGPWGRIWLNFGCLGHKRLFQRVDFGSYCCLSDMESLLETIPRPSFGGDAAAAGGRRVGNNAGGTGGIGGLGGTGGIGGLGGTGGAAGGGRFGGGAFPPTAEKTKVNSRRDETVEQPLWKQMDSSHGTTYYVDQKAYAR